MPSKRRRTREENREQARRWRRRQGQQVSTARCRNCGDKGHNRMSCPLPPQPGLCQQCSMPATSGKLCAEHRERHREKINASWRRRHPDAAVRVCARCQQEGHDSRSCLQPAPPPEPPRPPKAERRPGPRCQSCAEPPLPGKKRCAACLEKDRAAAKARRGQVSTARCRNCGDKGHNRMSCPLPPQPGLCQQCSMPATSGKLCAEHRERHREKINASWRRRHPDAAVRVCARCQQEGHDSRSCLQPAPPPEPPRPPKAERRPGPRCQSCAEPPLPGKKRCAACLEKDRAAAKARRGQGTAPSRPRRQPPAPKARWCAWCGDDCDGKFCSPTCEREYRNDAMRGAR